MLEKLDNLSLSKVFRFTNLDGFAELLLTSKKMHNRVKKHSNYFTPSPWVIDISPRLLTDFSIYHTKYIFNIYNKMCKILSPYLKIDMGERIFTDLNEYNADIIPTEIYMLEWLIMNFSKYRDTSSIVINNQEMSYIDVNGEDVPVSEDVYRIKNKFDLLWTFRSMVFIDVISDSEIYNNIPICKLNIFRTRPSADTDISLLDMIEIRLVYDKTSKYYYFEQLSGNRTWSNSVFTIFPESKYAFCFDKAMDILLNVDMTNVENRKKYSLNYHKKMSGTHGWSEYGFHWRV